MSRRELTRRIVMAAGAGVCLVLSLVLVLAAADVVGLGESPTGRGRELSRVSRRRHALGEERASCLSTSPARLLAVDDDIALRKALRSLRLAHLDDPIVSVSDPEVAISRNEAQIRLEAFVAGDDRPCPTLACRGSPRCARAREIHHGDPGARGAPVEHGREPPSRDCARSFERRGETQPRARVSARTRLSAD